MSIVEAEHPAGVPVSVAVEIGGREITFETGKLAKQADGAVVVSSGQTVVRVRMGLLEGNLVVNPTLEETEHSSDLDLIVVGTKDGLTMVEAGANRVPESVILEALEIAHREIVK